MIRGEREFAVFRPGREDFPSSYAFWASIFAIFVGIDIAFRPDSGRQSAKPPSGTPARRLRLRSPLRFGRPFSHISLELTVPTGREYIPGVVKREDSSVEAGIRGEPEKANSYPSNY
jgi:hypothetical protein